MDIEADVENAWDSLFRFVMDLLKYGLRLERDAQEKQAKNNGIETAIQNSNPVSAWPLEENFADSDFNICDKFQILPPSSSSSDKSNKNSTVISSFPSNNTEDSQANDKKSSTSTIMTLHVSETQPEG